MDNRGLWDIYRRWCAGQTISGIAENEGRDRKTVREYIAGLESVGLSCEGALIEQQQFFQKVKKLLPGKNDRGAPVRGELLLYKDELREMINRKEDPLKPKSAFLVVKQKHKLDASYETFKRFARSEGLSQAERKRMIRIELPPGLETQLDYGRAGMLRDRLTGKNFVVHAFCALLSFSRLPYVEFVRSQDQVSFVGSTVRMIEYYGGVTEFISPDNLKSGVIKPDLWDPQLNRAFAEMAEHYRTFIDPCRVARATDKAKVERFVPVARELFRMLKELYPTAGLTELNEHALRWCREEYGTREHGTTGVPPIEAFQEERPMLKALPEQRFVVPEWKRCPVHSGDQFLTFHRMRFSLPARWRGQQVWARYAAPVLDLYDDAYQLIRQYVIKSGERRYWKPEDFPAGTREMMHGGYPKWIVEQARPFGVEAVALVSSVLDPNAYLNARRARGMLPLMEEHFRACYFPEVCRRAKQHGVRLPSTLKRMLELERCRLGEQRLPISPIGEQMVRDIGYYLNQRKENI
jgi:transposase